MADKKGKIILCEDDTFIAKAYKHALELAGFELHIADNGEDGVKLIKKELPDLVVLDIVMPKKNGFEVLEDIKKDPVTKDIPVLMLSNLGQSSDMQKAKDLGAVDYLIKANWLIKDIIKIIEKYLSKNKK